MKNPRLSGFAQKGKLSAKCIFPHLGAQPDGLEHLPDSHIKESMKCFSHKCESCYPQVRDLFCLLKDLFFLLKDLCEIVGDL